MDGNGSGSTASAPPLGGGLNVRLSLMMFLQYAIWGAWLPLLWPFLNGSKGFDGGQIGNIFAIGAVGAIVAPFIAGQVADRWFNTEKFLALSHLAGAAVVWQLASADTYEEFLTYSLIYSLIYSPTLPLTNSLAFHHLPDRDRDFGRVRVWGTVGWIVAGILIGRWLLSEYAGGDAGNAASDEVIAGYSDAFRLSAILGLLLGVFCLFFLPKTPPSEGRQQNASFAALEEVRFPPLLILFVLAVPDQFYFVHTSTFLGQLQEHMAGQGLADGFNSVFGIGGGGLMTIGQMTEIGVLAAIPLVAKSVSRKSLLLVGLIAYALRMAIFTYAPAMGDDAFALVLVGVGLHGFCFGCFIFVAFMVVDEETSADVRASAQSLFNLVIIGIGVIVGSKIAGFTNDWADDQVTAGSEWYEKFSYLFSVPMWASVACAVVLILFYPSKSAKRSEVAS